MSTFPFPKEKWKGNILGLCPRFHQFQKDAAFMVTGKFILVNLKFLPFLISDSHECQAGPGLG